MLKKVQKLMDNWDDNFCNFPKDRLAIWEALYDAIDDMLIDLKDVE